MSDVVIREYENTDWPAVCAVHDRSRPVELDGSCDPRGFVPLADDLEDASSFERSRKLVACSNSQVVAFVGVDGDYLSWLYVDPDHFGKGLGRRLLKLAMEMIGPAAWTIALAGNSRAIRLYESEGFRIIERFDGNNAGYPCKCVKLALEAVEDRRDAE